MHMQALCTEASLASLRRHYPQIYDADEKLVVEPGRVRVARRDFLAALQTITPASHRSAAAHARPLPPLVAPVLLDHLQRVTAQLQAGFPAAAACLRSGFGGARNPAAGFGAAADGDVAGGGGDPLGGFSWASGAGLGVQRPRLLICGPEGTGQAHLGPALLYALEGLPVHAIGLPALLSDAGARAPEEALVHAVVEARRAAPAVLFLPHLQVWRAALLFVCVGLVERPPACLACLPAWRPPLPGPPRLPRRCGGTPPPTRCVPRCGCCWQTCRQTCPCCCLPQPTCPPRVSTRGPGQPVQLPGAPIGCSSSKGGSRLCLSIRQAAARCAAPHPAAAAAHLCRAGPLCAAAVQCGLWRRLPAGAAHRRPALCLLRRDRRRAGAAAAARAAARAGGAAPRAAAGAAAGARGGGG